MEPMILVSFIVQIMLVAGTGRLINSKLGDAMISDYRAVLKALERSYPLELGLPPGTLDTDESLMILLCNRKNASEIGRMMSELVVLDLTGMNLKHLPVYGMLQMASLKKLILDDNKGLRISQSDIGMISRLPIEEVSICSSNINFETFKALQGLPNLTRLDVSYNSSLSRYTGNDKFGDLATRLVELSVLECNLGSDWLDAILRCAKLTALNISKNTSLFENKVPSIDYSLMRGLTTLNISQCSLNSVWLCDILKCTNLVDLNISYNGNIGVDPTKFSKFGDLNSLKRLNIDGCNLTTASLNEICKYGGIEELSIGWNKWLWADDDEVDFGTCRKSLRMLKADSTGLDEKGLRALCGLPITVDHEGSVCKTMEKVSSPNLAILDINWNKTLGPVISQEGFSFGCLEKTLTELSVAGIGITGSSAVKAIGRCERLLKLNVSNNSRIWNGADTLDFGWLKSRLQVLYAEFTELPSAVFSKILEFDRLVELKIRHNDASCQGLGSNNLILGGVKDTLREIDMRRTKLTGEGLQWIFRELRGLESVDARHNRLIGPADLMRLDFEVLRGRLIEFKIMVDDEILAGLQKRLPLTRIYTARS